MNKEFLEKVKDSVLDNVPPNFNLIKVEKSEPPFGWYIGTESYSFILAGKENELDSSKLVYMLNNKYEDKNLLRKFRKLKTEKEMYKIAKQFGKDLELTIIDLEGGELIKGYCKLGY